MADPSTYDTRQEEAWRRILMGEARGLERTRRMVGWIPSPPRCKLCLAPLRPPGSVVLSLVGYGPSRLNRRLCRACFKGVEKQPGGAEIELSFLFADVRGSTTIAERVPAPEFSRLMSKFYGTAAKVVDGWDGLVDKFVGDEVVALFIPGFAGPDHAERAIGAARDLLEETANNESEPWIPIGAGVHTGEAFVGRVGEEDACDFTAVGDAVNTTAGSRRLPAPGRSSSARRRRRRPASTRRASRPGHCLFEGAARPSRRGSRLLGDARRRSGRLGARGSTCFGRGERRRTMYARIARFEGGDPGRIDEQISDLKAQMDAARSGNLPADAPEQARTLMEVLSRFVQLVDRRSGASLGIAFFETEDDMRRADAALNEMSPPDDAGKRTSVEMFEVALDESFR